MMDDRPHLTPRQLALLRKTEKRFGRTQRDRGKSLHRHGAVGPSAWDVSGQVLTATVQGTQLYRTRLIFHDDFIETECTCPYATYCKHAAALVSALIEDGTVGRTENKGDTDGAVVEASGTVGRHVKERMRQKLSHKALKFVQTADRWHASGNPHVEASEFFRALGRPFYWGAYKDLVQIYPSELPPRDAEEFLAWLSLAARKREISLPAPLPSIIDHQTVQRLQAARDRLEEVRKWKSSLAKWGRSPQQDKAGVYVRLRLATGGAAVEARNQSGTFVKATRTIAEQAIRGLRRNNEAVLSWGSTMALEAATDGYGNFRASDVASHEPALVRALAALFEAGPSAADHVVAVHGGPLEWVDEPLRWKLEEPASEESSCYRLNLVDAADQPAPPAVAVVPGTPVRYVTTYAVYPVECWPADNTPVELPALIPAAAVESTEGLAALRQLGLPIPARLAPRVRAVRRTVAVDARLVRPYAVGSDYVWLRARVLPDLPGRGMTEWSGEGWEQEIDGTPRATKAGAADELLDLDDRALSAAAAWLQSWPWRMARDARDFLWLEQRITGRDWPRQFADWLAARPDGCELNLEGELATLADGRVSGRLHLDIEEAAGQIDWFDLRVALEVTDTELSESEIALLLKAAGRWVRLEGKGWRRLEWDLSEEDKQELAALGLAAQDIGTDRQRLHVLQLGALTGGSSRLLPDTRVAQVRRRLEEIKTRVTPALPQSLTADLRPYQIEGFNFLAYLAENRFGGVLADDMGLGKTVQALAWLAWLRESGRLDGPVLVVCPKSVQDNWRAEAAKFYPGLRVEVWTRASAGQSGLDGSAELLVIHYAQLRNHAETLQKRVWGAVIVDEAQAIKNPASQNARTACALVAPHRLALTGTPIENRLTDLWSIFAFAMPGVLGNRASFTRQFERRDDPLARRRLAARTRPFLLRRTKNEVARDLPERVEEDLFVEMEGRQADLYRAELKRARAQLLNIRTPHQLDKLRFNILTSLLRLRQICCHPRLVGFDEAAAHTTADGGESSAKVSALLETLEPLMEEGQKVLVFSQFVTMLELLEAEAAARSWARFMLTGDTEDRGPLVEKFQNHDGPAIFFISLKAGGTGLNLTAASYVVLYDPWWNPAVEAQAIDRTHRIGQKKTVFAYRLLVKDTIEEKIRALQRRKGQLARDILGEENFAQALTLDDFRFLLGDDEEESGTASVATPKRSNSPGIKARRRCA